MTTHEDLAPGTTNEPGPLVETARGRLGIPLALGAVVTAVLALGGAMFSRAAASTNKVALATDPKGVTVVEARATSFRATRRYVATTEPWLRANVGPQLDSAYVDTVLVRPGARVARGAVLATLDCKSEGAASRQLAMRARALEAKQAAVAKEAARVAGLLDGGFVSANEAEQKRAETDSMEAQLLSAKAQLAGSALQVDDCVLRAPFDGEVAERAVDPGAFVRPGQTVVTLVDRTTVRVTADVPESDFDVVRPGTPLSLRVLATGETLQSSVARRGPAADPSTRTVHIELDVSNADRRIPVGTTAELSVEAGDAASAIEVPLVSASIRGGKATLFVVSAGVARRSTVAVRGERGARLFLEPTLAPGSLVVTEGRGQLADGDHVAEQLASHATSAAAQKPATVATP